MVKRHPGFHRRLYAAHLMLSIEKRLDKERPEIYPEMRAHLRQQRAKRLAERFGV